METRVCEVYMMDGSIQKMHYRMKPVTFLANISEADSNGCEYALRAAVTSFGEHQIVQVMRKVGRSNYFAPASPWIQTDDVHPRILTTNVVTDWISGNFISRWMMRP